MKDEMHSEVSSFEKQLLALTPATSTACESQIMYACGYQAGLAAAEKSTPQTSSHLATHSPSYRWAQLLLAACISCIIVGPAAYWIGRQNGQQLNTPLMLASNLQTDDATVVSEPAPNILQESSETPRQQPPDPSAEHHLPKATASPPAPQQQSDAFQSQPSPQTNLTRILTAWLRAPLKNESIVAGSQNRYLTSRAIQDPNNIYAFASQFENRFPSPKIKTPGNSNLPAASHNKIDAADKPKYLGYIESLRNISTDPQDPSLLQWMN